MTTSTSMTEQSAFSATLYPHEDTRYVVHTATHLRSDGRAYVRIETGGLAIQSNCWEHMQRLVDALSEAIYAAKRSEQDADAARVEELVTS